MEFKYRLKEDHILECYGFKATESNSEEGGNEDLDSLSGEPKEMVIDMLANGGILFFAAATPTINGTKADATMVMFNSDMIFALLIPFKNFRDIFYKFKDLIKRAADGGNKE